MKAYWIGLVAIVFACNNPPASSPCPSVLDASVAPPAPPPAPPPPPAPAVNPTPALVMAAPPQSRLVIVNNCSYPVWIQQSNMPSPTPAVTEIAPSGSTSYHIPSEGLASTRFWPKTGCDSNGNNCVLGQSSPPCPAGGCPPPVDSKIEATWGCLHSNPAECASTPQGHKIDQTTWWNASAVDGYTMPYTITIAGGDGRQACIPVDCSALSAAGCPTDDNLSTSGRFPQFTKQDEHVKGSHGYNGCFSTCSKLTYPTYGGDGVQPPQDPRAQMYCCPTPPISSPACQAGPVPQTKYVKAVHTMCKGTVYGYAYDDGVGLRNCSSDVVLTMTIGPNCP